MDDSLNVLYCIPVAVAVAQAAVDEGGSSGPDKGHETVVGVPGIDHGVEFRAWGIHFQMIQLFLPVVFQLCQFPGGLFCRVCISVQNRGRFRAAARPQHIGDGSGLARSQGEDTGERAAGIFIVAGHISQISGRDSLRVAVSVIFPKKMFLLSAVGGHVRTGESKEPLGYIFLINLLLFGQGVQVAVNLLDDPVALELRSGDEQRILQIYLILFIIAVVGKFRIAGQRQIPLDVRTVRDRKRPHFMTFSQGNIIEGFGFDPVIACRHAGISHSVAAGAFVVCEILAHRLPGGGPVIPGLIVTNIEVSSRLIKIVKNITENPPVCAGFYKAVAAGMVGDDRAVFRGTQIIHPGRRRIRPVDHILPVFVVKISISHMLLSVLSL